MQFAAYGLRYKTRLFYVIGCSLVISLSTLMLAIFLKPVLEIIFGKSELQQSAGRLDGFIDYIYAIKDWLFGLIAQSAASSELLTLSFICVLILFTVFIKGIFQYINTYMVQWIGNRVILDIQRELFEHMLNFNAAYYTKQKVGYLISYFTADTRVVGMTVFYVFGRLMLDPVMLLGTLVFLVWMNWKLTLLYAFIFPFIFLTIRFFARKNRKAGRKAQDITARLGAFLQEHFSAIRLIQGYSMYPRQRKIIEHETRGVFDASMSMARAMGASSPINEFLGIFAVCSVVLLAATMIFNPDSDGISINGGDFVTYVAALVLLYQPIKRIERAIQQIQHGIAAAERIFDALNTDASLPQIENAKTLASFDNEIRFDNVSFSYDGEEEVLKDISFTVQKGQQIALVGPSGAGKSTLVNLIPRFYDPVCGSITIDGIDLSQLKLEDLRRKIGMVYQDVIILGDAVRLNITCGDESYTDEQVVAAARAAYADEFISKLQNGYDTVIGERGESLSGGQCQRIAIARAFLRDAPILILDEATSSLDSESELHIKRSLNELMQGRTSFVIAHRLSTILQADRILVMERGAIVDIGRHDDLLERCDLYRRLYDLQFSNESDQNPCETV